MTTTQQPGSEQSFVAEVASIYRDSTKPDDIFWNVYVARPLAAVLVWGLRRTPVTPNQVTLLGALGFAGVAVALIGMPGWAGMAAAAVLLEFAYLLDCADGQLARLESMTSEVGAYLDFLIDEIKALVLVGACSIRVFLAAADERWLFVGIAGMALVSISTSLTNFVRRPEYAGREIKPGESARRSASRPTGVVGRLVWAVQALASWLIHYPSWFVYLAAADWFVGFDGARWFLYLFLGVYAVYAAKTGLAVVLKLGAPSFYDPD